MTLLGWSAARDSDAYISATSFAAHLSMRAHMQALRIQLSSFDEGDTVCLEEQQLGEFLRTQAMELELLEDMQPSFLQHYCNTAARKIVLFHSRKGIVKVKELLTSPLMKGFVTPAEIYTSFKDIHVMWVNIGEYADLSIYDVVDKVLDMGNGSIVLTA
ncbi:uncharacterized protein HaLaN_01787 [Haematococcus lacustris]|uniref:Uncharacterized protein n=1 Tax=Haematococcus lacustris TaxID=44745 RepID=A0A699YAF8_HAELA|nr:uncharacterized protein HaLaN_01787 [Haematococcus lacustris]